MGGVELNLFWLRGEGRAAIRRGLSRFMICSLVFTLLTSCTDKPRNVVVVYTALDSVFSREILDLFEAETGIQVLPVFDTEATKTTGLVERIRAEEKRPRCDVFWNNEILRTIRLGHEGLLASYVSPAAADIPDEYKSKEGLWTGFAARARVVAYDPDRVSGDAIPRTHQALTDSRWKGQLTIANPQFGTTGTHFAILRTRLGDDRFGDFLTALAANDVLVVASNSKTRDRVLQGHLQLGLTDTDDVAVVQKRGERIGCALYEDDGGVLIPNTIALIQGAPNEANGRKLIDFLLSKRVEARLAASPSAQIPVREDVAVPSGGRRLSDVKWRTTDWELAAQKLPETIRMAREALLP